MRINFAKPEIPPEGTERIVTKFLWLPKIINRELRWLEIGCWFERVETFYRPIFPLPPREDITDWDNPWREWVVSHWFGTHPDRKFINHSQSHVDSVK